MSTPSVPITQHSAPRPDEQREAPAPGVPPSAATDDRAMDADLLLDIPQLSVEELSLELNASVLLDHVKLEAKGLETRLYLRADFGSLAALAGHGEREQRGRRSRAARMALSRGALRGRLAAPAARPPQPAPEPPETDERDEHARRNGHDEGAHDARERVRHAVAQGAKAAGLTAAGFAGAALLDSRVKPSRKLHIPRRRTRARFLRDELAKRLP